MLRRYSLVGLVAAALLLSPPAAAQDATTRAKQSFEAGAEAYARRDFRAAAREFEEAYRLAPRAAAIYNAGLSWEGVGDRARAADDYATALAANDLADTQRTDAATRLHAIETKIGRVAVSGPPGARASVEHVERAPLPLRIHLEPGGHTLRVEFAGGRTESRTVYAAAGAESSVAVAEPAIGSTAPNASETAEPPASAMPLRRKLALGAIGGAVFASAAAIYFFEEGSSARDDFVAQGSTSVDLHDKATSYLTYSHVAWGLAGALVVTGVVLYVTAPSADAGSGTAAIRVGPSGGEFVLRF